MKEVSRLSEDNMKIYLVFKFSSDEVFIYIVEAINAEYAITLVFGNAIYIGSFKVKNSFGDGGFAVELNGKMYNATLAPKFLNWLVENQAILQNNN